MNKISKKTSNITSDGSMTVTYWGIEDGEKWNIVYYSRERVAVNVTAAKSCTLEVWFTSEIGVSYQLPIGDTVIELTKFLPMVIATDGYIRFEGYLGSGPSEGIDIYVTTVGAENKDRVVVPYNNAITGTIYQVPPHAIYAPHGQFATINIELGVNGTYIWNGSIVEGPALRQYDTQMNTVSVGDYLTIGLDGGDVTNTEIWRTYVQDIPCGVSFKFIVWQGRLGGKKSFYWLVKDVTEEVTDSQEIQAIPNADTLAFGVDVRKNYRETMVLYLPNLDAYDIYYYSDIITSNDVTAGSSITEGMAVRVLSSSVKYPNGNERGRIEVTIEYTNHDTIGIWN